MKLSFQNRKAPSIHYKREERAQTFRKNKGDQDHVGPFQEGPAGLTLAKLCFTDCTRSCPGLVPQCRSLRAGGEKAPQDILKNPVHVP